MYLCLEVFDLELGHEIGACFSKERGVTKKVLKSKILQMIVVGSIKSIVWRSYTVMHSKEKRKPK